MKNTTLCYIENEKGEYLMLHRVKKQNDLNHDKWIGVGGKCEEGESPEECVCRETWEETGLTLTEYRYRGVITFVSLPKAWSVKSPSYVAPNAIAFAESMTLPPPTARMKSTFSLRQSAIPSRTSASRGLG